jgi:hypothetical protein
MLQGFAFKELNTNSERLTSIHEIHLRHSGAARLRANPE